MKKYLTRISFLLLFILSPFTLYGEGSAPEDNSNWMETAVNKNPKLNNTRLQWITLPGLSSSNKTKNNLTYPIQLQQGMRYFYFSVSTNFDPETKEIKENELILNANLNKEVLPIEEYFKQMKTFLDAHARELIVLDFYQFDGMTAASYALLQQKLDETFGSLIADCKYYSPTTHLSTFMNDNKRVVIIYGNNTDNANNVYAPYACVRDIVMKKDNIVKSENTAEGLGELLKRAIMEGPRSSNNLGFQRSYPVGIPFTGVDISKKKTPTPTETTQVVTNWLEKNAQKVYVNFLTIDSLNEGALMKAVRNHMETLDTISDQGPEFGNGIYYFEHGDYNEIEGYPTYRWAFFPIGSYPDLEPYDLDQKISSYRIEGPLKAKHFSEKNFQGDQLNATAMKNFDSKKYNDKIRSIIVAED